MILAYLIAVFCLMVAAVCAAEYLIDREAGKLRRWRK